MQTFVFVLFLHCISNNGVCKEIGQTIWTRNYYISTYQACVKGRFVIYRPRTSQIVYKSPAQKDKITASPRNICTPQVTPSHSTHYTQAHNCPKAQANCSPDRDTKSLPDSCSNCVQDQDTQCHPGPGTKFPPDQDTKCQT